MSRATDFDIKKFNEDFERQQSEEDSLSESDILPKKYEPKKDDEPVKQKKLYDFTINDFAKNYKNSMVEVVDILVKGNYKSMDGYKNLYNKLMIDKYLLYIGMTLIVLAILGYLLSN
jgi:hypothetical protein